MDVPELYLVGGPNGAGKTTIIREFLQVQPIEYLSADQIAWELSPHQPELVPIEAVRVFVTRLRQFLEDRRSFLVESTLSGKSLKHALVEAARAGYHIEIKFLFIDSADMSLARVRQRVKKGGHHVPARDVLRRFKKSLQNFWLIYRELVHL